MSKTVTTEIVEEAPSVTDQVLDPSAEIHANQAENQAGEAEKKADQAEVKAEEANQSAKAALEAKETTEKLTFSTLSVVNGLKDSINLVVQRMEQVLGITKEHGEQIKKITETLEPTLDLHQEQIGNLDEAANKVVTATAALVKLHKEMNQVTE